MPQEEIASVEIPDYALTMGELAWAIAREQGRHRCPLTDFTVGTMANYRALIAYKDVISIPHAVIDRPQALGSLLCSNATDQHREACEAWPDTDTNIYVVFPISQIPKELLGLPQGEPSLQPEMGRKGRSQPASTAHLLTPQLSQGHP